MKFKDWFEKKLVVGSFPCINGSEFTTTMYDIIINVSDEYYPDIHNNLKLQNPKCEMYWFPMNEAKKDVGLNSIYGAMVILRHAEKENKRVYLHCHAGVNRSKCVQSAYYFMRSGEQIEMENNGFINRFVAMCSRGYLPPKTESEKFLTDIGKQLEYHVLVGGAYNMGGILDNSKIGNINNF